MLYDIYITKLPYSEILYVLNIYEWQKMISRSGQPWLLYQTSDKSSEDCITEFTSLVRLGTSTPILWPW